MLKSFLSAFNYTQSTSLELSRSYQTNFARENLPYTTIVFLVSSAGVALKLEKVGSIILVSIHFHPRHPLQQMETVSMPK